ncbi:MAG: caspase family protein, partial [Candidatus Acidiferrales bacterium]
MKAAFLAICLATALLFAVPARAAVYYVTVAGLGGEPDYEQEFTSLAMDLDKLLKASGSDVRVYTLTGNDATRAHLRETLEQVASEAKPDDDFVLTLIGHGSFDGVEYKFNLPGPDISAADLAALCDRVPAKRQLIVNTTSASGGSVAALEKHGRAVIAATKSGPE